MASALGFCSHLIFVDEDLKLKGESCKVRREGKKACGGFGLRRKKEKKKEDEKKEKNIEKERKKKGKKGIKEKETKGEGKLFSSRFA